MKRFIPPCAGTQVRLQGGVLHKEAEKRGEAE